MRRFLQRRQLLKNVTAITAGSLLYNDIFAQTPQSSKPRWAMLIDLRACFGCQACTVSCHHENQLPLGFHRTKVENYSVRTENGELGIVSLPQLCNHCRNPICTTRCPVKATYALDSGIVVVNQERCIGCGMCVALCPYHARFINPITKKADKCTFCIQRISQGLLPACVESCSGKARIFGDLNDKDGLLVQKLRQAEKENIAIHVLKPEKNTQPHVFYIGLESYTKAQRLVSRQSRK